MFKSNIPDLKLSSAMTGLAYAKSVVERAMGGEQAESERRIRTLNAYYALMTGPRATPPRWKKVRKLIETKDAKAVAMLRRYAPAWQFDRMTKGVLIYG